MWLSTIDTVPMKSETRQPMNLSDFTIDQIVRKDCLDKYEEGRQHIYAQLHLLNTDIFIVDKFVGFPSDLFLGPEDMIFWSRVVHNSLENTVLKIIKLSEDDGSDKLTIHTFK